VAVHLVDIGRIVDHHCLNLLFKMTMAAADKAFIYDFVYFSALSLSYSVSLLFHICRFTFRIHFNKFG